ncbi:chemotaxis protein CheW [Sphingomonas soli]|uniref:chemotaxis protein CheW n=1 Tax=Sphingomonas soli TaxID=266127 RepID=UPI00082F695D|nr:chemotaxis protein CheW [Sphingomonas soli]
MSDLAAKLREAFDRSFAATPGAEEAPPVDLLAIRAGGKHYAIALADVAALVSDKQITPLPSARQELLGVANLSGDIVPVYGLSELLGDGGGDRPRWIAIARHMRALAFAFEAFEGHLREPAEWIAQAQQSARRRHISASLTGKQKRPVISLRSLIEDIESSSQTSDAGGEK